uniref:Uncharacterized protein n=1 Tax=Rousettus aegyptiacus TaxID=9407 RepID=A0A7J8FIF8_ROUAE|nr:hypothetical protein HJG63_011832 [Rousettus aegyptiacus]
MLAPAGSGLSFWPRTRWRAASFPPSPPRRGNEAHERDPSGPHATRATAREDPCGGGHSTGVRGAAVSGIPESQACARRRLWAQPQMPRARLALHIYTPYVHTHVHTHRHTIRARTHAIRAHAHAHTRHTCTRAIRTHHTRERTHTHTSCAHILHTRLRLQRQIHVCTLNVCTCLCERAHASTYKDLILYNGMISFYNFLKSGPDCSPGQHRKRGARFLGQTKAERRSPDLGWKRLPPLEFCFLCNTCFLSGDRFLPDIYILNLAFHEAKRY